MHLSECDMSVCLTCIIYERPEWERKGAGQQNRGRRHQRKTQTPLRRSERGQGKAAIHGRVDTYCRWRAPVSLRKGARFSIIKEESAEKYRVEKEILARLISERWSNAAWDYINLTIKGKTGVICCNTRHDHPLSLRMSYTFSQINYAWSCCSLWEKDSLQRAYNLST